MKFYQGGLLLSLTLVNGAVLMAGPLPGVSPPIVNPANNHTYILLNAATWTASEAEAVAGHGHLATIRSQAEEDWVFNTFGAYGGQQRLLWIGFNDLAQKSHYTWSSGEPVTYTDWAPNEPDNSPPGEDYVAIYYPNHSERNEWNDWGVRSTDPIGLPINGVAEFLPAVTNVTLVCSLVRTNGFNLITLQWPLYASAYVLAGTTNLGQPFQPLNYRAVTNTSSSLIFVSLTNPGSSRFFRLQK